MSAVIDTPTSADPRKLWVPVRLRPDEMGRLDALVARYGAAGRSDLIRLALDMLERRDAGATKDELIARAMESLRAAAALPDGGGVPAPAAPEPLKCERDIGGAPCGGEAAFTVRTAADGPIRLCPECVTMPRYKRCKKKPIGGLS